MEKWNHLGDEPNKCPEKRNWQAKTNIMFLLHTCSNLLRAKTWAVAQPTQSFMGRKTKTILPTASKLLKVLVSAKQETECLKVTQSAHEALSVWPQNVVKGQSTNRLRNIQTQPCSSQQNRQNVLSLLLSPRHILHIA